MEIVTQGDSVSYDPSRILNKGENSKDLPIDSSGHGKEKKVDAHAENERVRELTEKLSHSVEGNDERLKQEIDKLVTEASQKLVGYNAKLSFTVFENSGTLMASLIDKNSGKVLSTMPMDKFLKQQESLDMYLNLFIDKKA